MKHIQIELNDEEDQILRTFMWLEDEDSKKIALKKLIKECMEIPKIKKAIQLKKQK
jgi:hypothetical protein